MIRFFVEHPTAANLLMAVLLVMGLLSTRGLQRETFPDITPNEVEVRVLYPGATAEEVEEAVCRRIEDAIDGVNFVKELRSDARESLATVVAEMEDGGDFTMFLADIQSEVDGIDTFPAEVEEPRVTQLGLTDLVLTLVVSGPMQETDLKAYCEDLKTRLQQLPDVSLVRILGFSERQLRVELSADALMRHQLSAAEVADIISRQSVNLPAGVLETSERDVVLRFIEQRRTPQELADLVILADVGGAEVRLGDIAQVRDVFELEEERVVLDGRRAGLLQIEKAKNQDVIDVAEVVKKFVEEERVRYPMLDIRITQDVSSLVVDRLQMLIRNCLQGVVLVFLTLWLFFSVRLSFWVAMTLPVSFLGGFFLMTQFGLTINMLTMVGLLLAVGILMDDGIVIAENIAAQRARGKSPMESAIDGVSQVRGGVLSAFLTTVCVLGPLAMIAGDIGKVLRVVPIVLILVLVISLVEAFCILPAHLYHSFAALRNQKPNWFHQKLDDQIERFRSGVLGTAVDLALAWRYLFVGCVGAVFLMAISLMAGGVVKFQAFPELDGDVVAARILMPPGTPLARTERVVDQVTDALERVNEQFAPLQSGGQDLVKTVVVQFNENPDAFEHGPHVATVTVDLLDAAKRTARIDDILQTWRDEVGTITDVLELMFTEPALGPAGRPIELRIQGRDLEELQAASGEVRQWLEQFVGVNNLADDVRLGKPELQFRLREGAFGLGLDAANVARQLRSSFQGITVDEIQIGPELYEIDVRLNRQDRSSMANLETYYFTHPSGQQVPLGTVVSMEESRGWSRIARVNGQRTVTVRGDVDTRQANTADILNALSGTLVPELEERYPDVRFAFEGEAREAAITQQSMLQGMAIGLIGVFVLLSFQFRSYLEPLTVMMAIPLALIGVIGGHLLLGLDISMPSMLGFASLAGIVVNDSILLVLFLKQHRDEGLDVLKACGQASRLRFRAILLTSLTTVAGLLPLMLERSLQAQVLIPLAVSIAFGLMASTVLVLFVVPCLYAIFADFGWVTKTGESQETGVELRSEAGEPGA